MTDPEIKDMTDGGLRQMLSHLEESYGRLGRAADRSEEIDLNDFDEHRASAPSFRMSDAAAQIHEVMRTVVQELDRRDADYESQYV